MSQSKSYRVPGGVFRNGVLIKDAHQNIARAGGKEKSSAAAPIHPGMVATKGATPLAFVGGKRPLDDESCDKLHIGKQVPVAFGQRSRTERGSVADGFEHLQKAGRMGAPVGGWKR
jgi:hypothetical protein